MKIDTFEMERWQSTYEHRVDYDLSESGVQPIPLRELLGSEGAAQAFLDTPLGYPPSKGSPALREKIAATYGDADPDQIIVTNGSAESIFVVAWRLVEAGDEVVLMVPNYMQYDGLVRAFGGKVRPLPLREDLGWQFDPEELKRAVTKRTKAIAVCDPDNPTGAVMDPGHRRALLDAAREHGAWLLSDEVYIGAEREGPRTRSLFGEYEKVVATNGLSKAYGLPGLRIGWAIGPKEFVQDLYRYHDYLSLTLTQLGDRLAQVALEAERREAIFERTRSYVRRDYDIMRRWIEAHGDVLGHVPPRAGAICFLRYRLPIRSRDLAERLRAEESVLVVPGDHFAMDGYLRIGMGNEPAYLTAGLERIGHLIEDLARRKGKG